MTKRGTPILRRIVRRCFDVEHSKVPDEGNYFGEIDRKMIDKLVDDGLILAEDVSGRLHWRKFSGFTDRGRNTFLSSEGQIKSEYQE